MLFLCTGNSARSQMAEAILRRHAGDRFNVHSAGLIPQPIHPLALQVMEEAGYDLSRHTSKGVKEYLGMKNFAFVISVCPRTAQDCPPASFPTPATSSAGLSMTRLTPVLPKRSRSRSSAWCTTRSRHR